MIYSISQSKKFVGIILSISALFGFLVLPTVALAGCTVTSDCGAGESCTGTAAEKAGGNGVCAAASGCHGALDCGAGQTCKGTATELKAGTGTCVDDTFGLGPINNQVKGKLGNQDIRETAASLINVLLGVLGLIAVVIVLAGGFKWMTAGGNDEKVGEARKMIFSGVIGLAIILSAWAISLFVINQLSTATGGSQPLDVNAN